MSGGLPPAPLRDIVDNLFQNEKVKINHSKITTTFSQATLTEDQKAQLIYPDGFIPLDKFIVYQINTATVSIITLAAFIQKGDHIYGYYYEVIGQPPYDIDELACSRKPVSLSPNARFIGQQYLEVYNNLCINNGIVTILLGIDMLNIAASIQYQQHGRYYDQFLQITGIDPNVPAVQKLTGLSKNLRHFDRT
jgi:hypothetical protein